ncbi:MAG: molybdopterin-guanine dinucleotide biosynthesis protein B [Pseudomonadota bacterium]
MKIFGLAGWSGSGKTTLMTRLIPAVVARGFSVSTVKHAHRGFDIDQRGKDSYEHREAGAKEVMIASAKRWALMHELRTDHEPTIHELIANMAPVDLLLVEGFKQADYDKIEVHRVANGKPLLLPKDPRIVALASDQHLDAGHLPRFDLNDAEAIAGFIVAHCGLVPAPQGVA